MGQISGMVKSLVSGYLILNILIQAAPGDKYRKYLRTFGGFLMIVSFLGQIPILEKILPRDEFAKIVQGYAAEFENVSGQTKPSADFTVSEALSTVQDEIKTKLNKSEKLREYTVYAVKISICEDELSENFGAVDEIMVYMSSDVEKSVHISVNKIDVRQNDAQNKNERETEWKNVVAEELGVDPDVVSLCME